MAKTFSKAFGPTSTTDDVLTTIGAAYQFPAVEDFTITEVRISYGQTTNANEAAALLMLVVPGVTGSPFVFAFGNGAGGATNSNNQKAEEIKVRVPVPRNTTVTVKVISAEQLTDVIVSLGCEPGLQAPEMTLCAGGAGQDTTADTLLALSANAKVTVVGCPGLVPFRDSTIRRIRIAGSGVVDAKVGSGILYLTVAGYPYPLEFAFGKGSGGAATSSVSDADEIKDLEIPIRASSTIGISVLTAEIMLSVTVSIDCD